MKKCSICGSSHNVVLGENTLFNEFGFICEDCLSRAMTEEFAPSPLEIAQNKLDEMGLSEDNIHAFTVEDTAVIVEWLNAGQIEKTILVDCDSNDEAIDVLCELC